MLLLVALSLTLSADRVTDARARRTADLTALLRAAGLTRPPTEVYLRVFKREAELELWAGPKGKPLTLVKTYPVCAASGGEGPKRKRGDLQVPEGLYDITAFNSVSQFHLSLQVGYPNRSDRIRGDKDPGDLIFIHGGCASIGCVALQDGPVEEIYLLALDAAVRRVDLFPTRGLVEAARDGGTNAGLWSELAPALERFDRHHRPVPYRIAADGRYVLEGP